jgi:hypothetical protein
MQSGVQSSGKYTLALHKIIAKKAKNLHFYVIINHVSLALPEFWSLPNFYRLFSQSRKRNFC